MDCPICKVPLLMSSREGIEIDYCPQCRGVWLDRGELDKIIERSAAPAAQRPREAEAPRPREYEAPRETYREPEHKREHHGHGHGYKKKKHQSFLGELFDFD